jgi:hypothetical protein
MRGSYGRKGRGAMDVNLKPPGGEARDGAVGWALCARARAIATDLPVLDGFEHSRMRQRIFGG